MKKNFLPIFLFMSLTVIFLVSCSNDDSEDSSDASEDIHIELASSLPEAEHNILFEELEENFEENSDGRITFDLFADAVLGGEAEGIEQASSGEINMVLGVLHSSLYYAEYDAPSIPYLFSGFDEIMEYMEGPMGKEIDKILLEEANLLQKGYYSSGPRWMTANKPVNTAKDINGLKIRLSENPLHIGVWDELGAVTTPMPSPDVFSALQTNVIDSQENFLSNIVGRHFDEVQDYLMDTEHLTTYGTFLVNNDWWNDLSNEDQEMVQDSIDDALEIANSSLDDEQKRQVDDLEDKGMELIKPDKEDIRDAAKPGIDKVIDENLEPEVKKELENMEIIE